MTIGVALLSREQIGRLPDRARQVVEYRKSGLSLNHIQGCPLDCAYCIRHTYGLWDQRVPRALMTDAQAVEADRYHHLEAEVRPNTEAGRTVISDRYIPSGLVMQRFDGIDPVFLWQLNAEADRPDLAVILEADPEVISERLRERGPHNRFQLSPGSSHAEVHFYRQATERLIQAGFDVLRVDCNQKPPEQSAALIRDQLMTFFASHAE